MRSSATTVEQAEATAGRWPWWYGLAALGIASAVALGIVRAVGETSGLPRGVGTLIIEVCFAATAIFVARQCGPLSPRTFGCRRLAVTPGRAFLWMVLGIIGMAVANTVYSSLIGQVHLRRVYPSHPDGTEAVLLVLAAVVAAPVAEELLFRGLLYRALRNRWGVAFAVGLSAVLFGVMHWWFGDPAVLIFPRVSVGVVLALLYEHTGSLYPSMALHAWVNLGVASVVFPGLAGTLGLVVLAGAVTAVAMSISDPRRKKFQRPQPQPPEAERFTRTSLDTPESMRHVGAGQ